MAVVWLEIPGLFGDLGDSFLSELNGEVTGHLCNERCRDSGDIFGAGTLVGG
jgi:hypothetical protein